MNTPLHALIIEDAPEDALLMDDALTAAGFDTTWTRVDTSAQLLVALEGGPWDVILCDFNLPQFDGEQALRVAVASTPEVPVIVVTGTIGEERLADAMRAGARDFVLKSRLDRLGPAVKRELVAARVARERRENDARLQREQDRFRALVEKSPESVVVTDAEGRMLYASPSAFQLLGYSPDRRAGRTLFELFSAPDAARTQQHISALAAEEHATFTDQVPCVHPDGSRHWIELSGSNLLNDPDVRGLVFACRDITERRLIEEEKQRDRARAESLLELLENPRLSVDEIVATAVERAVAMTGSEFGFIGLVAEDGTTVATRMSRRAAEQCGMNPDVPIDFRISGDGLWSTCLKDRRSFFVNEYVAKKELPPGHVPLRRVLGVPVVRDGKSVLICGLGNKTDPYDETDVLHVRLFVEGVCGAIERIRQEQALRRNERHYRALMEQSLDVVAVVAPDGAVIYQSPSIERVLGWRVPEVLGRSAYDFVHNDDREIATRLIGKVQPGAIAGGTLRLRHRDGSWRTLEAIVRNLTQDPDVAGIVVNARDITERQKLEAQYLHAQKLEAFGQLAGGIAHDFNNVLVVLLMQFGMMQREPNLPPAITGPLREMEALANRAASLTRQLLIFSRRQEYSMRTLDLNRAIEGVCGMLKRLIGENIEFNFQPAASPLWVEADVGMIEQVAVNLCVNARDAMPEGGRLSVTLASELRGSEMQSDRGDRQLYACLVVADTGCGMDEETRKRVFEPFFTTKPVGQGTGLGLATVYGIARQHHGWAEVETAPHRGSTFRVFFPCVPAPVDPRNEDLAQPPTGGTESVLLVEDEEFVRHAFALCLRRAGYAVVEAANAAEAVNAWHERGGAFALLLTDMLMPGRSGLDLAMELVAAQPALRVIVASGYTAQPAGSGSPFTPHLLYLAKPCSPDQLLRTIRTALDAK